MRGVIRESTGGAPMARVTTQLFVHGIMSQQVVTNSSGGYSFTNVDPGQVSISVIPAPGQSVQKMVSITPGQNLTFDISVPAPGQISGKITDEDRKPLKGIRVTLLSAEYAYGALRYVDSGMTSVVITDDDGEYTIPRVEPGRAHFVYARKGLVSGKAISGVPDEPDRRKPVLMPAYYPGMDMIQSATPLVLAPGEKRELVDIQMKSAPSRCLEGTVRAPDGATGVRFEIGEAEPAIWAGGSPMPFPPARDPGDENITIGVRGSGITAPGPEGRIRICDLHSGSYWLNANADMADDFGSEPVTITDKDVSGIVVTALPQFPVQGDVVWDGQPPKDPVSARLQIAATGASVRAANMRITFSAMIPHHFALPVRNEDYVISVQGVPAGTYVKDVTYGGQSILNEVFHPGAASAAGGLRIVLAREGGSLSVKAADKDGNNVAEANVVVAPAGANSAAAMASAMITGQTDSFGAWASALIAPGKYYVIATSTPVNHSVETIDKLWRARGGAEVVEVGAGAMVQVNRVPAAFE